MADRPLAVFRAESALDNLFWGVFVLLAAPEIPSCHDCLTYVYDDNWKQTTRGGKPVMRDKPITPCHRCPKSKDGLRPNPGAELSLRGWQCYRYFLAARSGIAVTADELTRQGFATIQMAYDRWNRYKQAELRVVMLMTKLGGGK